MSGKPILRVLSGEPVWPPPIWLMRQAGRYLPEYRAARASVPDLVTAFTTPDLATEITLQPIRRFGMDAAILYSDILIVPWALGEPLAFREGEGPVLPPIRTTDDLRRLDLAGFARRAAPVMETVRRVRAALPNVSEHTALIGFVGAPFTVACYMVADGSKDHAGIRRMAFATPTLIETLVEVLTEATIGYLAAQAAAGAEALMIFDSWAGVLPPSLFDRLVIRPTATIVAALRARCPDVPVIGFPRLAGSLLPGFLAGVGPLAGVGIDTAVDPVWARAQAGHTALQGNLDPMALVAGGAAMDDEARAIREALRGHPHIFNLGHGIVPETPPDHVARLTDLVRAA